MVTKSSLKPLVPDLDKIILQKQVDIDITSLVKAMQIMEDPWKSEKLVRAEIKYNTPRSPRSCLIYAIGIGTVYPNGFKTNGLFYVNALEDRPQYIPLHDINDFSVLVKK